MDPRKWLPSGSILGAFLIRLAETGVRQGDVSWSVFPGAFQFGSSSHLGVCMQVVEEGKKDDRDPNQNQSSILPKTEARLFLASGSGQIPELSWPFSVFHSYHIRS